MSHAEELERLGSGVSAHGSELLTTRCRVRVGTDTRLGSEQRVTSLPC